jgi:hypothetical protein
MSVPTVPTTELADKLEGILTPMFGEQKSRHTDDDGEIHFGVMPNGIPLEFVVEPLGNTDAVVAGVHVLGTCIEDRDAAKHWVANQNRRIRFGRLELVGDGVIFFHHLFASGVNEPGVRHMLGILNATAEFHPDLAEKTGALSLADYFALNSLQD